MKEKISYIVSKGSIILFSLLAILYVGVFITSLGKNAIDMCVRVGWDWKHTGNYVGLIAGFAAYVVFLMILTIVKGKHNLNWFMKFTHELTHTLVALVFFRKIHEFVVRGRECFVHYDPPKVGYLPITLSPYCIPIYTLMIFPYFDKLILFLAAVALCVDGYYASVCYHNYKHGKLCLNNTILASGSSLFTVRELFCNKNRIGIIKILQTPADRRLHTCKVKITVRSENADHVRIRNLNIKTVKETLNKQFNLKLKE